MAERMQGQHEKFMEQEGLAMREKALIVCLCVFGVLAVSYGMIKENNAVFILGLLFVIGGYLLIRRRLKESIKRRS
jgi:Flp pilus assembly protein TadB